MRFSSATKSPCLISSSYIFFHGLALRLGMTTPTTTLRRSPANGTLVEPSSRSDGNGIEPALRSDMRRHQLMLTHPSRENR